MLKVNELARQSGGQTDKLLKGPQKYEARTVTEMVTSIVKNAGHTIEVLTAYKSGKFQAPMARKVRNGIAVKIGYGSKNEALSGIDVQYFWSTEEAVQFLTAVCEAAKDGALNDACEELLASYRERAERGKAARRKNISLVA